MEQASLEDVVHMVKKTGVMFLTSADHSGMPHVCAVTDMAVSRKNRFRVCFWGCSTTAVNAHVNPRVSLVVWDKIQDKGYQILGLVQQMPEPEQEQVVSRRQREGMLWVEAEKILHFKKTPHTDREALGYLNPDQPAGPSARI